MRNVISALLVVYTCLFLHVSSACARTPEEQAIYDNGEKIMTAGRDDFDCGEDGTDARSLSQCLLKTYEHYDIVMNQVYQVALKENAKDTQIAIRAAQRKWLAFRKTEGEAMMSYTRAEPRGTIMNLTLGNQEISGVKERISELMMYLGAGQI